MTRACTVAGLSGLAAVIGMTAVIAAPRLAVGQPHARQRVVLADPDPELRHAMEQALAPYHLAVVIEGPAPADAALARERADADTARFVVWRDGADLVVFDRELGTTDRRASRSGVMDPPTAAAAALTIKTMMRLPPPPGPDEPVAPAAPPAPPPAAASGGVELRLQAGLASRIAHSDETDTTSRTSAALALRPWPAAGWRIGVAGDLGSSISVDRASFKGTFSDWAALGFVSWTYARGIFEVEPLLGFGMRRSTLDGAQMSVARTETATLATARAGLWARLRVSRFSVGAGVAFDEIFGTPTYTKDPQPAEIFQVPASAIELGAVIAIDL